MPELLLARIFSVIPKWRFMVQLAQAASTNMYSFVKPLPVNDRFRLTFCHPF
jgi:hypothetical protein